jgi:biotin operon repressor
MSKSHVVGEPFVPYKEFVGILIPNCILSCPDIGAAEKLVWGRLAQYAGQNGLAFPKQDTLAKELGITRSTVAKALKQLEEKKFIQIHRPQGANRLMHRSCSYKFLWHPVFESDKPSCGQSDDHPEEHNTDTSMHNNPTPPCAIIKHPVDQKDDTQLKRIISKENPTKRIKREEESRSSLVSFSEEQTEEQIDDGLDIELYLKAQDKLQHNKKLSTDEAWAVWCVKKKHIGRYPAISRTDKEIQSVELILKNIPAHHLFESLCEKYFSTRTNFIISNAHSASLLSKQMDLYLRDDVDFNSLDSKSNLAVKELVIPEPLPY